MMCPGTQYEYSNYDVIFEDRDDNELKGVTRWLRWLKPGFRHVAITKYDGDRFICVNVLFGRIELFALPCDGVLGYDAWLKAQNATAVVRVWGWHKAEPLLWWEPATCVTVVKHLLALSAPLTVTPYQLYEVLTNGRKSTQTIPRRTQRSGIAEPRIIYRNPQAEPVTGFAEPAEASFLDLWRT